MSQAIEEKVASWLAGNYDELTKQTIRNLQATQPAELEDSFIKI